MDFYRNVVMLCCMLFFLQVFGVLNASESLQGIPDDQQMAYQMLNLKADASDDDIIKKLDDPYGPMAMNLIMRKNIVSAVPRLLAMVRDEKPQVLYRCAAAETLAYFGNNDWIPVLRSLAAVYIPQDGGDLNSKIKLAGTLAKIDNSYLPFVLENTNNKQEIIRVVAVRALSGYDDPNSISDIASDAILTCAQNDPNSSVRFEAILSMEHMCSKKPRYEDKFLKALNANINSKCDRLKLLCEDKLIQNQRETAQEIFKTKDTAQIKALLTHPEWTIRVESLGWLRELLKDHRDELRTIAESMKEDKNPHIQKMASDILAVEN